jgi:hypothetical protein
MIESRIDQLEPSTAKRAEAWLAIVQQHVWPVQFPGYSGRITETLRDTARRLETIASGASTVKVSYHEFGRAFDFICLDEHGVVINDGSHPIYLASGLVWEALGGKWGGRFTTVQPDYDHCEYHPGMTIDELVARRAAGLGT